MNESLDPRRDEHPHLLEIQYRNPVHVEVMIQMIGDKASDLNAFAEWEHKYLHRISDILDQPEQEELRATAREGRYKEAAETIVKFLREK